MDYLNHLAIKHPSWYKVILLWLDKNNNLNIQELEKTFKIFFKNKHILKKRNNIKIWKELNLRK